jgi:L-aspartate semialdehyde sulfurtransferase ferredoxin
VTNVRVKLTFPEHLVKQPIIARMVREFNVLPNIRRASVEETMGWIVCELGGEADSVEKSITWLRDLGVEGEMRADVVEG